MRKKRSRAVGHKGEQKPNQTRGGTEDEISTGKLGSLFRSCATIFHKMLTTPVLPREIVTLERMKLSNSDRESDRIYRMYAATAATAATPPMLPLTLAAAPVKTGGETPPLDVGFRPPVPAAVDLEAETALEEPAAGVEEEAAEGVEGVVAAGVETAVVEAAAGVEVVSAAEVVAAAVVLPPPTAGREIGWPAAEHWETTTLETAIWTSQYTGLLRYCINYGYHSQDWAARSQFCWTQGVTSPMSWGFWQWQAKSVRDEHPSLVRAVTKQLSWLSKGQYKSRSSSRFAWLTEQLGTSGSWALARPAATRATRA